MQCPKCKSPYWDQERVNGEVAQPDRGLLGTHRSKAGETQAVAGSSPARSTKPDLAALREMAAGTTRDADGTVGATPPALCPGDGKVARRTRPQDVRAACPECHGLNGVHMKGCKR